MRRIRVDEWQELRELRLRALLDAPDAYGSTFEEESQEPESTWRDWAAAGAEGGAGYTAIAVGLDGWVGLGVGAPHLAFPGELGLFAMWVDHNVRREGIGRGIVEEIAASATSARFPSIRLLVTESNEAAIRLYASCGFVDTGGRSPLREGSAVFAISMIKQLA